MTDNRVSIRARVNIIMWVEMNRGLLIIIHGVHRALEGGGELRLTRCCSRSCDPAHGGKNKGGFFDKGYMFDNITFQTYGFPLVDLFNGFLF